MPDGADGDPDDDPADALYDVAPEEFVAERNRLAKELRAAKQRDAATQVAALRRPSVAAWALNQVARHDRDRITDVLDLVDRYRDATDAALDGDAGPLREVQAASRRTIDGAVKAAMGVLSDDGRKATDELKRRVSDTLHAALVDADVADALRLGRLADDHTSPGFGFALGQEPSARAATGNRPTPATKPKPPATRDRAAERAAKEAERERRRLTDRADELEERAAAAEARAKELRAEADAARAEVDAFDA